MKAAPRLLASALMLVSLGEAVAACPLDSTTALHSGDYAYSVTTIPPRVSVGEHFALELVVCVNGKPLAADIGVDAKMPVHKHGMNYAPTVTRIEAGKFLASGMLLHMPGHWQFVIDLRAVDQAPLVFDFDL